MTEPELKDILSNHLTNANKPTTVLRALDQPDFPQKLFKEIGIENAYAVVLSIYHGLTVRHRALCEVEKAIIREVRSWDKTTISEQLRHLRGCFLESELK